MNGPGRLDPRRRRVLASPAVLDRPEIVRCCSEIARLRSRDEELIGEGGPSTREIAWEPSALRRHAERRIRELLAEMPSCLEALAEDAGCAPPRITVQRLPESLAAAGELKQRYGIRPVSVSGKRERICEWIRRRLS